MNNLSSVSLHTFSISRVAGPSSAHQVKAPWCLVEECWASWPPSQTSGDPQESVIFVYTRRSVYTDLLVLSACQGIIQSLEKHLGPV